MVSLTASTTSGCNNSAVKQAKIYSTPQPNFTLDLPPFSCSSSPSQFNDTTPNPTDSNLSSWAWRFGDGVNGSSTQRNPLYTFALAAALFCVLTRTTNICERAALLKPIAI